METNTTPNPTAHQKNIIMAILAYLGPLIIVSYIVAGQDSFVKFHIKQGLLLFIVEVIISILGWSLLFWGIANLINLIIIIFAIMGIINAAKGEEKELPLIGHLASNFKF